MSVAILYLTNTLAPHAMMLPRIVTLLLLVFSAAVQPVLYSYLLSTIVHLLRCTPSSPPPKDRTALTHYQRASTTALHSLVNKQPTNKMSGLQIVSTTKVTFDMGGCPSTASGVSNSCSAAVAAVRGQLRSAAAANTPGCTVASLAPSSYCFWGLLSWLGLKRFGGSLQCMSSTASI
jgi:hypothetical protein